MLKSGHSLGEPQLLFEKIEDAVIDAESGNLPPRQWKQREGHTRVRETVEARSHHR